MLPKTTEVARVLVGQAAKAQEEMDVLDAEVVVTGGWNGSNIQRLYRATQRATDLAYNQSLLLARMAAVLENLEAAPES